MKHYNLIRTTLITIFLSCGLFIPTIASAEAPLKLYTLLFKPYGYLDEETKKVTGISQELFTMMQERMGLNNRVEVLPLPPKRMVPVLKDEQNILLFPLVYNKKREAFLDWVFHFNDATFDFAMLKGNEFDENFAKRNLKGVTEGKIGVVRGTIFEATLLKFGLDKKRLSFANSAQQNLKKLINKRVDYIFSSRSVIEGIFNTKEFASAKDLVVISDPIMLAKVHMVRSKNFDPELLEKINKALQSLVDDGSVQKLLDKYSLVKPTPIKY